MAVTRALLKGMGLTDEQVSSIIEAHTESIDGLKADRDKFKADSVKLAEVQKELDTLKKDVSTNNWEHKYNEEHSAFEKYKADVLSRETAEKLKGAYRKLLTECKVGDKHIDSILRVTDFSNMKLNDSGSIDGSDELKEKINSDWSGFIVSKEIKGSNVDNPPGEGNPESAKTGVAAKLAAKYHDNLYGKVKEN